MASSFAFRASYLFEVLHGALLGPDTGELEVAIHKYPGADHAFARIGGKAYTKPEADRALDFFKQHLAR